MERRTLEENRENKRDYAVLVGLRSPVLREDNADEESLAELAALVETAGGQAVGSQRLPVIVTHTSVLYPKRLQRIGRFMQVYQPIAQYGIIQRSRQ